MKHQALFSSKDRIKKIKVSSAAVLQGALYIKSQKGLRIRPKLSTVWRNHGTRKKQVLQ